MTSVPERSDIVNLVYNKAFYSKTESSYDGHLRTVIAALGQTGSYGMFPITRNGAPGGKAIDLT